MATLSPHQVAAYRDDGVLFPFSVLTEKERAAGLGVIDRIDAMPAETRKGLLLHKTHMVSKTLTDICRSPRILDLVEGLIGPNILVWGANFFLKEAHSDAYVSWHQDATYWGLEPADIVTAWVAFMPSTVESGCMRVVPGTHKDGLVEHRETWAADNLLSRGQEIAVDVDLDKVVDVVLKPGEMSLHHVKIAHNSEPNRSNHRRIGFAIRYVAAHVKQAGGVRDKAIPVRGVDRWNYFDHEDGASGEFLPADLERHAQSWGGTRLAPKPPAKAS
ncbi:phytanoyl-CoA dioxygenase family protein [Terrarubrum flagellatum]|uniref:phytanoyl-CoA dioxygenase family protein n=1 Tax=Terrirubrum flagellatum TaxID=2895980 RepID=UPI003144E8DC